MTSPYRTISPVSLGSPSVLFIEDLLQKIRRNLTYSFFAVPPIDQPISNSPPNTSDVDNDDLMKKIEMAMEVEETRRDDSSPEIPITDEDIEMEDNPQLSNIDEGRDDKKNIPMGTRG